MNAVEEILTIRKQGHFYDRARSCKFKKRHKMAADNKIELIS